MSSKIVKPLNLLYVWACLMARLGKSIAEDINHNIHNMTSRVKQVEQEFIKNGSESVALAALVVSGHKAIDSKFIQQLSKFTQKIIKKNSQHHVRTSRVLVQNHPKIIEKYSNII